EAGTAVAPVVGLVRGTEAVGSVVAALADEPLAGPARVHREREFLVVLGDRERPRVRAGAAARVGAPGRGEQLDHGSPVDPVDRLDVALPAARVAGLPRVAHAVVTQPLLHEGDEPRYALDHQVVQRAPLVLHRLAQRAGLVEIAAVDRLDRPVHRRPRHLAQLSVAEPPLTHSLPPRRSHVMIEERSMPDVLYEKRDPIAYVTLNLPDPK